MRVMIAADTPHLLRRLSTALEAVPSVKVTGSAHSTLELIPMAIRAATDALVIHIGPGTDCEVDRVGSLQRQLPSTAVVILFTIDPATRLHSLLRCEASAFLPDDELGILGDVLRSVGSGHRYVSPRILDLPRHEDKNERFDSRIDSLTAREKEILFRIGRGEGTREIAIALGIRPRTVDAHRASMMKKLNIHKLAGLVRLAVVHDLAGDTQAVGR